MPTYDYKCQNCQFRFERFMKITDDPGVKCPNCGSSAKRLISAGSGLIFKGSGFYAIDYRKPKPKDESGDK